MSSRNSFETKEEQIQDVQQPDRFISAFEVYLLSSYPALIVNFLYLILFSLCFGLR